MPVTITLSDDAPADAEEDTCIIAPQNLYLNLLGIASFEVRDGRSIEVRLAPAANLREVRLYLLGTCFGMLLHQRGILAFHASSIVTPKGAVFFTGPSGIGKSTLLNAMTKLGYPMLSDDVIGVQLSTNGSPAALPSFPRSKLRDDSARSFGLEPSPEDATNPDLDKTQLDLRRYFSPVSAPVHHIYALHVHDSPDVCIVPKNTFGALASVIENTYRAEFLNQQSLRNSHFGLVTELVNHTRVFDVYRPKAPCDPERLARALEQHFLA